MGVENKFLISDFLIFWEGCTYMLFQFRFLKRWLVFVTFFLYVGHFRRNMRHSKNILKSDSTIFGFAPIVVILNPTFTR